MGWSAASAQRGLESRSQLQRYAQGKNTEERNTRTASLRDELVRLDHTHTLTHKHTHRITNDRNLSLEWSRYLSMIQFTSIMQPYGSPTLHPSRKWTSCTFYVAERKLLSLTTNLDWPTANTLALPTWMKLANACPKGTPLTASWSWDVSWYVTC